MLFFLVPDLENEPEENQLTQHAASTPVGNWITKDQFDVLSGKVNDLFDKCFGEQEKVSTNKDNLTQLSRKLEHVEGNLLPELKMKIKTVKKSIPADASLPRTNKEGLEQVRAGLERARAKIAILEQPKQDQKFKLSDESIGKVLGMLISEFKQIF